MGSAFVANFAGLPRRLDLGRATGVTAELGDAVVHGRPFILEGGPLRLDPDGPRPELERTLKRLDGRFSLVVCGRRRAVVATDILGSGGAYLSRVGGQVWVASHLGLATRSQPRWAFDAVGAMGALTGSICVDGRTPFEGIRRLMAGEYAIIDLAHDEVEGMFRYSYLPETLDLGEPERGRAEELESLLRESVEREGAVDGVFLTAGKDSRAIAGCLVGNSDEQPLAVTYGGWRSQDRRGAVSVARAFDLEHELLGPLRLDPRRHVDEIVAMGGGLSGLQISQHLAGAISAKRRIRSAYSGFLGDVLTGKPFTTEPSAQSSQVVRRHTDWLGQNREVTLDESATSALSEIEAVLLARLEMYRRDAPSVAATLVDLTHRQSNFISGTFDHMHQHVEIATPFFYRPLMSYLLSRQPEDLQQQRLYDDMLRRTTPEARTDVDQGPVARLAGAVDSRKGPYGTVNWPAITRRLTPWLRDVLEPRRDTMVGELGARSVETTSILPFAYFAVPLLLSASRPTTR